MPTLEATPSADVTDQLPDPANQLPVPPLHHASHGRGGSTELFQHCLDLIVIGNHAVGPARQRELIAAALEMTNRLAHAPFGLGRSIVKSAVVVDVDVDVDIASRQGAIEERQSGVIPR